MDSFEQVVLPAGICFLVAPFLLAAFMILERAHVRFNVRRAARLVMAWPLAACGMIVGSGAGDLLSMLTSSPKGSLLPWSAIFGALVAGLYAFTIEDHSDQDEEPARIGESAGSGH